MLKNRLGMISCINYNLCLCVPYMETSL
ncbi:hypothetical protein E2C01_049841 [Portunus trituberculatus]|uniref:Uncharacterized protein n=1 Tax=Portunus trituberculatus TaxID=210409 RepID=A0A5B7GE72_PORTR|nr:hypothetical protein [Portunus trituberculatus]